MLQCGKSNREEKADARRRRLLDTARGLFVAHGFHGTGMAQVAAASGIAVGQIYRDFAGKEAIIAAIVERDVTDWLEEEALTAAVAAGDAPAIRAWIGRFADGGDPPDECRMMTEILAESGRNPRIAAIHRGMDARVRASLARAIRALAPGCDGERLVLLVEFVLAVGCGATVRRIVNPAMPRTAFAQLVGSLLDREFTAAG